jgi:type IX secretion system PorP/SprF family membrane protein
MNRIRSFTLVLFLASATVFAQQDPISSQYMNNPLAFNPSYAGINDIANITLDTRFQWNALAGSPTTTSLAANSSMFNGKVGLGLMILNDKLGISNNTEVQLSYAYKIQSADKVFSFGLQTGVITYKNDYSDPNLNLRVNDDPLFLPGIEKSTTFNIGAGATYMTDKFFLSFSVPRLINTKVGDGFEVVAYERHYYLTGTYLVEFKSGFRMKPSVLMRGVAGAPLSFDLNLSFLIGQQFWVGAFTRNFNTYGLMAQFDFMDAYRIGYSFELLGNNFVGDMLPTHEIMLSADLALFSHQSIYKRFF